MEDIRDLLTEWDDDTVREKKETVTKMLEKKPKKAKVEKDEEKILLKNNYIYFIFKNYYAVYYKFTKRRLCLLKYISYFEKKCI